MTKESVVNAVFSLRVAYLYFTAAWVLAAIIFFIPNLIGLSFLIAGHFFDTHDHAAIVLCALPIELAVIIFISWFIQSQMTYTKVKQFCGSLNYKMSEVDFDNIYNAAFDISLKCGPTSDIQRTLKNYKIDKVSVVIAAIYYMLGLPYDKQVNVKSSKG